jgi:hypothetical protein
VYHSAVSGLYARLRGNYDFIYRRFGDEGLKLIEEMSHEYGLSVATRARKRLKTRDLASVAGYLMRIFDTVGRGKEGFVKPFELSGARAVIRVSDCPLHFESTAMCQAHTAMERTVVEELNPALKYSIGKSIPAGDAFCEHLSEIR